MGRAGGWAKRWGPTIAATAGLLAILYGALALGDFRWQPKAEAQAAQVALDARVQAQAQAQVVLETSTTERFRRLDDLSAALGKVAADVEYIRRRMEGGSRGR